MSQQSVHDLPRLYDALIHELRYMRDKQKREVDFLVLRDG